jgi:hypothetical protein
VSVVSQTTYYVTLSSVPDGKTVTPTDDVSIWLQCGQRSENYTTLAQVLADSSCLSALMADNNAVDYLVRSKAFIGNVSLIPIMSSATAQGIAISSSGSQSGFDAWKACDGDNNTKWANSYSTSPSWIQCTFDTPQAVGKFVAKINGWNNQGHTRPARTFTIQAKNADDAEWTDLDTFTACDTGIRNNRSLSIHNTDRFTVTVPDTFVTILTLIFNRINGLQHNPIPYLPGKYFLRISSMTPFSTCLYTLSLTITIGPSGQFPVQSPPDNSISISSTRLCSSRNASVILTFSALPLAKQELPMQITIFTFPIAHSGLIFFGSSFESSFSCHQSCAADFSGMRRFLNFYFP